MVKSEIGMILMINGRITSERHFHCLLCYGTNAAI